MNRPFDCAQGRLFGDVIFMNPPVGVMAALRAGVCLGSVCRPLGAIRVVCEGVEEVSLKQF